MKACAVAAVHAVRAGAFVAEVDETVNRFETEVPDGLVHLARQNFSAWFRHFRRGRGIFPQWALSLPTPPHSGDTPQRPAIPPHKAGDTGTGQTSAHAVGPDQCPCRAGTYDTDIPQE